MCEGVRKLDFLAEQSRLGAHFPCLLFVGRVIIHKVP